MDADAQLTIEPGVIIKFNTDTRFIIAGELRSLGTEDDKVIFTSNQTTPASGDWNGISFEDTSTDATFNAAGDYVSGTILSNTIVEYVGSPSPSDITAAISCYKSSLFIYKSIIRNNSSPLGGAFQLRQSSPVIKMCDIENNTATYGSAINLLYSSPLIENNNFINNGNQSIRLYHSYPVINRNNIISNSTYFIYIDVGGAIDAKNNWWGTDDLAVINGMIYDYYDYITLGEIVFQPIENQLIDFDNLPTNYPPSANAGQNQAVFASITLDGSQSSDPDSDPLTFSWQVAHRTNAANNRTATGVSPSISNLQPGFYNVTLTVSDPDGLSDTDTMVCAATGKAYTQEQLDSAVNNVIQQYDANGDGQIGLEEAIRALQVTTGLKPQP